MTLAEQYAQVCANIKEKEKLKKELGDKLLAHMKEQEIGTIKADYGTFSKAQKFVYTYSDQFKEFKQEMKEQLDEFKEKEEKNQEPTIKEYLVFRSK